jgi:hypothetical protein
MATDNTVAWALVTIFALAGAGFLFAKMDEGQVRTLETLNRFFPAVRLYRFRAFRYGVAAMFFIMASVVYFASIAPHAT